MVMYVFSHFAFEGEKMSVHPALVHLIQGLHQQGKPQGFICVAPVIAAKVIQGSCVTVGQDPDTAGVIESMGGHHRETRVEEFCVDDINNIITTPAYMDSDAGISDIAVGIEGLVNTVLERVQSPVTTY